MSVADSNRARAKPLRERLMAKVDASGGPDACWSWLGHTNRKDGGYGSISIGAAVLGKDYVHRVMWRLTHGEIPDGIEVCHSCDYRRCVNPRHLFLGTRLDNMQDAVTKGRTARGSKHPHAKLSEVDVAAIRAAVGVRQKDLAAKYGVSRTSISLIRSGQNWAHIPGIGLGPKRVRSKLSEADVAAIRSRVGESNAELAREFGVNPSHVSRLRSGRPRRR